MNNVKKNRTGLRLLGSVGGKYQRFTMNKTQQSQPVYSKVQPRCPGIKGQRAGQDCPGSNTNVGCKTCLGCTYTFDVSSNAFGGAYPSYGSFASVNLIVDNSNNPPCEWQYNAIVEGFNANAYPGDTKNASVTINIENNKCVGDISGVYFYAPVGGANGVYIGQFKNCKGDTSIVPGNEMFALTPTKFAITAKRMGAPYRNPIAGWRNSLNCNYKDCSSNDVGTSHWGKQPTYTVYKDNYSGGKNTDPSGIGLCGTCPVDCNNNIAPRSGIQGRTHRPIIRSGMQPKSSCCKPNGTQCFNNYSYSYRQYQNNKRCMSYERSLEKYILPGSAGCLHKKSKNVYRKSSCCDCDCDGDMQYGPKCSNKAETHTVYKPSNKKFSNQGAVSSGSRLDRLKLDVIRASNSKCIKDKRCNTIKSKSTGGCDYKVPNGKYGAGKPRFTGWMFNGHHQEVKGRVYNMVRYNQQPLGIPQLTAHRLTLSQGGNGCGPKQCFPRTLNLGSNRATAAGNRARIPGSKCSVCCIVKVYGNAGPVGGFPALVPGTILYQPTIGYAGTILEQVADPTGAPGSGWGWLVIRFNGHGICKSPVVTTAPFPGEILSTNPSGWTVSDTGIKVTTLIPIYGNGNGCSCAPCANIPDQTAQGLPVC